jgi:hypothetical protein
MKFKRKRKAKTHSVWPTWWFAASLVPIAFVIEMLATPENAYWIAVKYPGGLLLASAAVCFLIMVISGIRAWRHPQRSLPRMVNVVNFLLLISVSCLVTFVMLALRDRQHLTSARFNDHMYHLAFKTSRDAVRNDVLELYQCNRLGITCHVVCEHQARIDFSLEQPDILVDAELQKISIAIDGEPLCTYPG